MKWKPWVAAAVAFGIWFGAMALAFPERFRTSPRDEVAEFRERAEMLMKGASNLIAAGRESEAQSKCRELSTLRRSLG
jgi:hypothetical protein